MGRRESRGGKNATGWENPPKPTWAQGDQTVWTRWKSEEQGRRSGGGGNGKGEMKLKQGTDRVPSVKAGVKKKKKAGPSHPPVKKTRRMRSANN